MNQTPETINSIGIAKAEKGKLKEAIRLFQKAIKLSSEHSVSHYNLGLAYKKSGRPVEAIKSYLQAIRLDPNYIMAYVNLGIVYFDLGDFEKAARQAKKALVLDPQNVMAFNNLGNCYVMMGRYKKAFESFKKALTINPKNEVALNNMGTALREGGYLDEALSCFKTAVKLNPTYGQALSNLTALAYNLCEWKLAEDSARRLDKLDTIKIKLSLKPDEHSFSNLARLDNPKRNLEIAKAHAKSEAEAMEQIVKRLNFSYLKKPISGKIRVGYIGDGFKNFPTGHNMARVFENHDRKHFEVLAYSYGDDDKSTWRKRIEDSSRFIEIKKLSFEEAASKIHKDRVDILVDLKGPTGTGRTEILILKPAPIAVNFLGFAGSTGSHTIDYFIGDKTTIPDKNREYFSEKIVYMPDTYWPTDNKLQVPDFGYKKADFGLPKNSFVFGSFNGTYKIEPEVFASWMRILKKVPRSVLWLLTKDQTSFRNLRTEAQKLGVVPTRLIHAQSLPKPEHLARLKLADIALDTRIVNGHTTVTDCLWADLPVITITGNHFMARVSASILKAIDLPRLITHSLKDYEKLAIGLASNPKKLQEVRVKLIKNKLDKPLFDTKTFTLNLEKGYRKMIENYRQGKGPKDIYI